MREIVYASSVNQEISLLSATYQNYRYKPHYHLEYHVGLIASGCQIFNYKGTKHKIGPNFIQIMMPGEVHDIQTLKNNSFSTQIFSLSSRWMRQLLDIDDERKALPMLQHCIEDKELYQKLLSLYRLLDNEQASQLALDSYPLEVFNLLLSRYGNNKDVQAYKIGIRQLNDLKEYLLAHLAEKIHLNDLATLCQLSEPQLLRHFKHTVGMTPYAWLNRLRLEQAMIFLRAGFASTEVSYKVGFYDQAHFIKAFKLAYGVTPALFNNKKNKSM